jgi:hypothetical protein
MRASLNDVLSPNMRSTTLLAAVSIHTIGFAMRESSSSGRDMNRP